MVLSRHDKKNGLVVKTKKGERIASFSESYGFFLRISKPTTAIAAIIAAVAAPMYNSTLGRATVVPIERSDILIR